MEHKRTLDKLLSTDQKRFSPRQSASIRGYLAFVLSATYRQYGFINRPIKFLLRLVHAARAAVGLRVSLRPARKPPDCFVDATPTSIAFYDPRTATAANVEREGYQAHNELLALLLAHSVYGEERRYVTDLRASLSLHKRSNFALYTKLFAAMHNLQVSYIASANNPADSWSRGPYGFFRQRSLWYDSLFVLLCQDFTFYVNACINYFIATGMPIRGADTPSASTNFFSWRQRLTSVKIEENKK